MTETDKSNISPLLRAAVVWLANRYLRSFTFTLPFLWGLDLVVVLSPYMTTVTLGRRREEADAGPVVQS